MIIIPTKTTEKGADLMKANLTLNTKGEIYIDDSFLYNLRS